MKQQKNITAKLVDADFKDQWNDFVENCLWSTILQAWEWGEVKKVENWKPLRVAVFENEKLILSAQVLQKNASFLGNYLYIPHGPNFQTLENLKNGFETLILFLKEYAEKNNCFAIELEPMLGINMSDEKLPDNLIHYTDKLIMNFFTEKGFNLTKRNTQPLYKLFYDLSVSTEELMARMKKNTRYNIRLAKRKGVKVKNYAMSDKSTSKLVDKFYDLLLKTQKRASGYPIRPYKFFKRLFKEFEKSQNLSMFEASFDKDTIGINFTQTLKSWSSSFYAASNRLHSDVKANYLLRWESVINAKEYGSKVYDFWGIVPDSQQHKGYSDMKIGFGGYRIDMSGIYALPIKHIQYYIWDKILPLRSKLLSLLKK